MAIYMAIYGFIWIYMDLCSYGHLLVITGYFCGIIHVISMGFS